MVDIKNIVEKNREMILEAERYIWNNAEIGYKEFKTNKYLAEKFERLGYKLTYADNITGFFTVLDTGREGPTVLVLAELDALICSKHTEADAETACVKNAEFQVGLIYELLKDGAVRAKKIIAEYKPVFNSIEEYLKYKNSVNMVKDAVIYNDDGTITIDCKS